LTGSLPGRLQGHFLGCLRLGGSISGGSEGRSPERKTSGRGDGLHGGSELEKKPGQAKTRLRKVTRNRGQFPSEQAALKVLYLAVRIVEDYRGRYVGTRSSG